jgi:hypothetical protein
MFSMPYTAEVAFDQFYEEINLTGDFRSVATGRRENVVGALDKTLTIVDSFSTGSIPRYTALKGAADLDLMVVLHYTKHVAGKTPTELLQSIRDVLGLWKTGARRNGQAVTLYYSTWPNVDIVPVSFTPKADGSVDFYNVPDSNTNSWIRSNPKAHSDNIDSKATKCGYNFRRIIKMIKHWSRTHSDYLQSYHIEVLAFKIFDANLDDTPWNVFSFFKESRALLASPLWYEDGQVDAYLTAAARSEALKRIDTAITQTRDAWYFTYPPRADHKSAIEKWGQVFGDKFPKYG